MVRKQVQQRQAQADGKRPVGFVVLGAVLLTAAAGLLYDVRQRSVDTVNLPSVYQYSVNQLVTTDVSYKDSEYYDEGTPGFGNTAYVSDLTKDITAKFHYEYKASREANLTATFLSVATIRGKYVLGVDGKTQTMFGRKIIGSFRLRQTRPI